MDFDWGPWDWDPDFNVDDRDDNESTNNKPNNPEDWDDSALEGGYY